MRRGFTAIELAVVLSISALFVPLVFMFARHLEATQSVAQWHLETAAGVQRIAQSLRQDARAGTIEATSLAWSGPCPVRYRVTEGFALERDAGACGGTQVLANGVRAARRVPGGVELTFGLALREDALRQTEVFLPLEAR